MNPKISLIMPVYNGEKYLEKSLSSIVNQTYTNIQIIIVNDGSTDNTIDLCENYARKDNRIVLINKENSGVSSARNEGLTLAEGEYIGFIDADDYIEPDMIERLTLNAVNNKADISMCGFFIERTDGTFRNKVLIKDIIQYSGVEAINNMLDRYEFHGYIWNKLFSKKIIKGERPISFYEDIYVYEDLLYCYECFINSDCIVYDNQQYYHHIIHDNQTSAGYNKKKLTSLTAFEKIIDDIEQNNDIDIKRFKTSYIQLVISLLIQNLSNNKEGNKEIHNTLVNELYRYKLHELTDIKIKVASIVAKLSPRLIKLIVETKRKSDFE